MTDLKQLRVNAENSQPGTFWGHVATPMTVIDLIDRIEALERENAELRKDAERLDWLNENYFHREMDDFDARILKRGEISDQWVFFLPKGVTGAIRDRIDEAMK